MAHSQPEIALHRYEAALIELEERTRRKNYGLSLCQSVHLSLRHVLSSCRSLRRIWLLFCLYLDKRYFYTPIIPLELLLNLMKARDSVQIYLQQSIPDEQNKLIAVVKLDMRLKKQAKWVVRAVHLDDWRTSFNPPPEAWWWFLEQQFGLGWRFLSLVFLAISSSLIGNIAPRFLTGGPDFTGILAIILQTTFALIAGGSIFSRAAGKKLAKLFPRRLREEWGTFLALALLSFLLLFQFSLPQIAACYRERGLNNYMSGHLASAEFNYQRSLALNPNDGQTRFYLGSLYEGLNDIESARSEYQSAMVSGSADAFNNMARLYILNGNYESAAFLLRRLELNFDLSSDVRLHYNLHKNLGWTRLRQGLLAEEDLARPIFLSEAKATLLTAIEIAEENQFPPENQAPAHCLLAQVIEAREEDQLALADWEYCLDHSSVQTFEEHLWKVEAQRRLIPTEIPSLGGGVP